MTSQQSAVVTLTRQLLHTAGAVSSQKRNPWPSHLWLLCALACFAMYFVMAYLVVDAIEVLQELFHAGLEQIEPGDLLFNALLLAVLALVLPALMVLSLRLHQRSRPTVTPHVLQIAFDADTLTVQRGATRMVHAWAAVQRVHMREPIGKLQGALVIELEYGYVHAWPSKAFESEAVFRYVAHKISALHMEHTAAMGPGPG